MSNLHRPYPLEWPLGQPRTPAHRRKRGRFRTSDAKARDSLLAELGRLGAASIVMSSNVPVRLDGLPYANSRTPDDPGIAVYFMRYKPYALACDHYRTIADNMRALALTVQSIRAIERYGSPSLLEQALSGFSALPAGEEEESALPWWKVLRFTGQPPPNAAWLDIAESRYRQLVQEHHPDRGGDPRKMAAANNAIRQAREVLSSRRESG